MKIGYTTLGCKVNQQETQAIAESFSKLGFDVAKNGEAADGYIINSCSVTSMADSKTRQKIRQARKQNPSAVIAVIGCYVSIHDDIVNTLPEVSIVLDSKQKDEVVMLMSQALNAKPSADDMSEAQDSFYGAAAPAGRTRAYIKIEDGCDRFCSYCIIPFARGNVRSRNRAEILKEAEALIGTGYKEIVITGINAALYGTDFGLKHEIVKLVSDISNIPGDFRIRLGSLEPTVINADIAKKLVRIEKLCSHLHLSMQSGSDRILSDMNRHYCRQDFMDIVSVLRESDEGYGISTDVIVGYPGETDADFADSIDMVERVKFLKVHVFKYSRRPGTKAAQSTNQIQESVKKERSMMLIAKSDEASHDFRMKQIGKMRQTLILGADEDGASAGCKMRGITDNGIELILPSDYKSNTFADILIAEEFVY